MNWMGRFSARLAAARDVGVVGVVSTSVADLEIRDGSANARGIADAFGTWPARQAMLATHRSRLVAAIEKLKKHRAMLDRKLHAGCAPNGLHVERDHAADPPA